MLKLKFLTEDSSFAFKILGESIRNKEDGINERSDKTIDTKKASFIELPNLKELQKKVEKAKEEQGEIELWFR